MLSQGVPMMLMGDEIRQTQLGNNNAYCQDNEITWFDWSASWTSTPTSCASRASSSRFRRTIPTCVGRDYFDGKVNDRGLADIAWHGCRLNAARLGRSRRRACWPSRWRASRHGSRRARRATWIST